MTDLNALLAQVKAATGPSEELDARLFMMAEGYTRIEQDHDSAGPRYYAWRDNDYAGEIDGHRPECTASIDAALALVEKMLPTYGMQVGHPLREDRQYGWYASVFRSRLSGEIGTFAGHFDGGKDYHQPENTEPYRYFPNGALAILAAMLTALQAKP